MRNLLRCRRGTAAFAAVIALVPLIGVVALGGEAGSWYITKQAAQNAADAAAYSGALRLACTLAGSCPDTQTVAYRGKEFAAQNTFCNAGDTSYPGSKCATSLPTGISQAVTINTLTAWNGVSGNFVQAIVQQTQPAYLASVLGSTTIPIGAQAVAQVNSSSPTCLLALRGQISVTGNAGINTNGCSVGSNDPANNALDFTGNISVNLCSGSNCGSLLTAGGCTSTGTSNPCSAAKTYVPPSSNPFSALNSIAAPTLSNCSGSGLTAYSTTHCTNNNKSISGNSTVTLSGVYFISGTLSVVGNASISGTNGALLILLPGANISATGNVTFNITALGSNLTSSQLPAAFQPYTSLLDSMVMFGMCTSSTSCSGSTNVSFTGNTSANLKGNTYLPTAALTFPGNSLALNNGLCDEVIASSITLIGNSNFGVKGCPAGIAYSQVVALVY